MSDPDESVPARVFASVAEVAAEGLLAAGFLFASDALAHLNLTAGGFALAAGGWGAALLAARLVRQADNFRSWMPVTIELVLPVLWLGVFNRHLSQPWSGPRIVHATLLVFALWRGWRWLMKRMETGGVNRPAEALRIFLVGLAAGGVVLPFFTDLQVGGTDAKWYTGVFIDFIQQLRAGFFPVFVGQGEFSFNGSVNLFRTAPLCLWLGGAWDLLTAQSLSPIALRNLAVISAAFGAGFGMYAALLKLRQAMLADQAAEGPDRWAAALIAVLYLQCPGVLHALYIYELQMTYTAMLALPWIVYGNLRTLHGTEGRGYVALAVGLALAWLAHPPLAILSTLFTVALQLGRFILEPAARVQWKAAAGGALLFALLGAYYFLGMSELPLDAGPGLRGAAVFLLGIGLAVFGVVHLFYHRHWTGSLAWLLGAGLVGATIPVWLVWVIAWGGLFGLAMMVRRRSGAAIDQNQVVWWALAAMLGAAALAGLWAQFRGPPLDVEQAKILARNASVRFELFQPLWAAKAVDEYGVSRPGPALWLLAILVFFGALRLRCLALSLLAGVMAFLLALVLSVPLASGFILGFAPPQIVSVAAVSLLYRLVPPLAALICAGGFLSLAMLGIRQRGWRRWGLVALVAAVAWSSGEAPLLVGRGQKSTASRDATARDFAPQNYVLGRYSYAMLAVPLTYIEGKQQPWLESRLLNSQGDLVVGPEQLARQAEEFDSDTLVLTSRVNEMGDNWRRIAPGWEVQPGETLLLRLEILPAVDSSGYLILQSEHSYQEHHLTADYLGTGFGIGASASHVLSVTNPGIHPEHFTMSVKVDPANTMPRDGRPWASLHLSRYHPGQAPVQLESLLPYRARVNSAQPGFLETPRQWLAGYRARVDGKPVDVRRSDGGMVVVPVGAGSHLVELRFAGTARLWIGLLLSSAACAGLLVRWLTRGGDHPPPISRGEFNQWIEANKT